MPPEERDPGLLWDMLQRARTCSRLIQGVTLEKYSTDVQLQLAIERLLEVIGEAARHVSKPFRAAHPEIPWAAIVGQRNVLAHEYGEIVQAKLWDTAAHSIPELIARLESLIPPILSDSAQ